MKFPSRASRRLEALRVALIVSLMTHFATLSHAETGVSGNVFSDTIWTVNNSPYRVKGNLLIGLDATLTIEPGVEVRVESGYGIVVGSMTFGRGDLVARGTADLPVRFTAVTADGREPEPGGWVGIRFRSEAGDAVFDSDGVYVAGSVLDHVIVEFAGQVGGIEIPAAVYCNQAAPMLRAISVIDSGGASISVERDRAPHVEVVQCTVRQTHPDAGSGAIVLRGTGNHTVRQCEIVGTPKLGVGGGIFLEALADGSEVSALGNTVVTGSGRGIYARADVVTIAGNSISEASHSGEGGGVYVRAFSCAAISGNTLVGNHAARGGGMFVEGPYGTIADNDVVQNSAEDFGGGIVVAASEQFLIAHNRIHDNRVVGRGGGFQRPGGGLYVNCPTVLLIDNDFDGNETLDGFGGGAFVDSEYLVTRRNRFVENLAAKDGGGCWIQAQGCVITDDHFSGNTSSRAGGGAWIRSEDDAQIETCTFAANAAATDGGAMYLQGQANMIRGCRFIGNSAGEYGGGIALTTGVSELGISPVGTNNIIAENFARTGSAMAVFGNASRQSVNAPDVCWGTDDPKEIEAMIHHGVDDPDLTVVEFMPFDSNASCYECVPDLDADLVVGFSDLVSVQAAWGMCGSCEADFNDDGVVDFADLLVVLAAWGNCT